jgi:hypothetical protein
MKTIFEDAIEEIDTFGAFFMDFFIKGGNVLIPYVNVGIWNHPINKSDKPMYLDYSYVACTDVALIKYNGQIIFDNTPGKLGSYQFIYLGGTNLKEDINVEYQVLCRNAFLQILEESKKSPSVWTPCLKNSLSNMDSSKTDSFFGLVGLPPNLALLLEGSGRCP